LPRFGAFFEFCETREGVAARLWAGAHILLGMKKNWYAQGESNPCFRRERGINRAFTNSAEYRTRLNLLYLIHYNP